MFNNLGFKWNSGGKGRYTVDSPENHFGETDTLATLPETLGVPMFTGTGTTMGATVPLTGDMLEAARVAAEGNAMDPNAQVQAMAPNNVANLVTSGLVPVQQVANNFMPLLGNMGNKVQQQQVMGMNQQAQAYNYAQQLNLLRYQQLAQAQQQQQPQQQNAPNNMMMSNGLVNNNGGNPFVNMQQQPPPGL